MRRYSGMVGMTVRAGIDASALPGDFARNNTPQATGANAEPNTGGLLVFGHAPASAFARKPR